MSEQERPEIEKSDLTAEDLQHIYDSYRGNFLQKWVATFRIFLSPSKWSSYIRAETLGLHKVQKARKIGPAYREIELAVDKKSVKADLSAQDIKLVLDKLASAQPELQEVAELRTKVVKGLRNALILSLTSFIPIGGAILHLPTVILTGANFSAKAALGLSEIFTAKAAKDQIVSVRKQRQLAKSRRGTVSQATATPPSAQPAPQPLESKGSPLGGGEEEVSEPPAQPAPPPAGSEAAPLGEEEEEAAAPLGGASAGIQDREEDWLSQMRRMNTASGKPAEPAPAEPVESPEMPKPSWIPDTETEATYFTLLELHERNELPDPLGVSYRDALTTSLDEREGKGLLEREAKAYEGALDQELEEEIRYDIAEFSIQLKMALAQRGEAFSKLKGHLLGCYYNAIYESLQKQVSLEEAQGVVRIVFGLDTTEVAASPAAPVEDEGVPSEEPIPAPEFEPQPAQPAGETVVEEATAPLSEIEEKGPFGTIDRLRKELGRYDWEPETEIVSEDGKVQVEDQETSTLGSQIYGLLTNTDGTPEKTLQQVKEFLVQILVRTGLGKEKAGEEVESILQNLGVSAEAADLDPVGFGPTLESYKKTTPVTNSVGKPRESTNLTPTESDLVAQESNTFLDKLGINWDELTAESSRGIKSASTLITHQIASMKCALANPDVNIHFPSIVKTLKSSLVTLSTTLGNQAKTTRLPLEANSLLMMWLGPKNALEVLRRAEESKSSAETQMPLSTTHQFIEILGIQDKLVPQEQRDDDKNWESAFRSDKFRLQAQMLKDGTLRINLYNFDGAPGAHIAIQPDGTATPDEFKEYKTQELEEIQTIVKEFQAYLQQLIKEEQPSDQLSSERAEQLNALFDTLEWQESKPVVTTTEEVAAVEETESSKETHIVRSRSVPIDEYRRVLDNLTEEQRGSLAKKELGFLKDHLLTEEIVFENLSKETQNAFYAVAVGTMLLKSDLIRGSEHVQTRYANLAEQFNELKDLLDGRKAAYRNTDTLLARWLGSEVQEAAKAGQPIQPLKFRTSPEEIERVHKQIQEDKA